MVMVMTMSVSISMSVSHLRLAIDCSLGRFRLSTRVGRSSMRIRACRVWPSASRGNHADKPATTATTKKRFCDSRSRVCHSKRLSVTHEPVSGTQGRVSVTVELLYVIQSASVTQDPVSVTQETR